MTLRTQNWLNSLSIGFTDSEGYLKICPLGDESELEVRAELLALNYSPIERENHICIKISPRLESPAAFAISKLSLRRTLRANNLESAFNAFLNANEELAADWADAQELKSDDPILLAAIPLFKQQFNLSEAQINEILLTAKIS